MFKVDFKKFIILFTSVLIFMGINTVATIKDHQVLALGLENIENIAPTIEIIKPAKEGITVSSDSFLKIIWKDSDPDDNAKITLFWDSDINKDNNTVDKKDKTWGIIMENISEDPDLCADEQDVYDLKVIGIPTWCPWSRYFYVLATIGDCKHYPVPCDYSGKVTVVTKASTGGSAMSLKGAKIIIGPNVLQNDAYLSVIDNPNEPIILLANFNLSDNLKINSGGDLNKTVHRFKAIDVHGNIYSSNKYMSNWEVSVKATSKNSLVITIPYTSKITKSLKCGEDNLRILYLNEDKKCWQLIEKEHIIDKTKKEVSVEVTKLGIYRLAEILGDTQDVWHSPNPLRYKPGVAEGVSFKDTTFNYRIKIYDLAGNNIKNISNGDNYYWNITEDGIASGVYFYLIFDDEGNLKHKDKIAIIK